MNDTLLAVMSGVGAGLQGFVSASNQQGIAGGGVPTGSSPQGIPVNVRADNSILILVAAIAAIFLLKK